MIAVSFCLKGRLPALVGPTAPAHHVLGLQEPSSVKDSLQALGIPHTEIDLMLVGGLPVGFGYRVRDGDRIEVHPPPAAAAGDETECSWPDSRLQPRPLAWERFVCDSHLGRLARLLRLLGFDTLYRNDWREPALAAAAARETRALLTCSRGLLMRRDVGRGMLILSRQADEQAREVLARFGLAARASFRPLQPLQRRPAPGAQARRAAAHPPAHARLVRRLPPVPRLRPALLGGHTRAALAGPPSGAGAGPLTPPSGPAPRPRRTILAFNII